MTADAAVALIVDDQTDSLASRVAGALTRRQVPVLHVPADRLGLVDLRLEHDLVYVDGARIGAVLFRAGPWSRFDAGFHADDAAFTSMEVSASWLAVLRSASIASLNRLDAESWTARSEWPIWRRRMLAAGVACVDVDVGAVEGDYAYWLPWGGGVAQPPGPASRRLFASAVTKATGLRSAVWFAGESFPPLKFSVEAGGVLRRHGVELAGLTIDDAGRVALCTARPEVDDGTANTLAPRIAHRLLAGMRRAD